MSNNKKNRTGFEMNLGNSQGNYQSQDRHSEAPTVSPSDPLCIAILGDFSGRENNRHYEPDTLARRRIIAVDRDKLEEVLAGFDINLQLWLEDNSSEPVEIPITELDDFHPDQLYQNVDVFTRLRDLRKRLQNNSTFAAAAKELQQWPDAVDNSIDTQTDVHPNEQGGAASSTGLLDSVLDETTDSFSTGNSRSGSELVDSLVKQIVAPYVETKTDPRQDEMLHAVDQAISAHMQFILHHPDFQALEAAWRSMDFLLRRVETGQQIKIYMLDITKHELEIDLSVDDITASGLYRRFCDPAPGELPWGLIVGDYRFTDRVEEIMSLLQIGAVARKAGAVFMAAVNETLVGCESFAVTPDVEDWHYQLSPEVETAWSLLRDSEEADHLAMVVPGFLLRAPYGKQSKPIESFAFEEMPRVPCHSCYLWGNGAFIKAEQMARAFLKAGWDMDPVDAVQVERLPMHHYQEEGETLVKPCAEIQLTEQGGLRMLQQGLIPLWSVKNSDSIRSADFHSLAL